MVPVLRASRVPGSSGQSVAQRGELEDRSVFRHVLKGDKVLAKPLTAHSVAVVVSLRNT